MSLQTNHIFDRRYRVVRQLGEGGYGAVYEVARVVGEGRLALKVLHPHLALDEEHQRRFLREAALVERLDHLNIVNLIDVGKTEDGTLFAAFEYLEGHTLGQLRKLAGGKVHEGTVVGWITQLLHALDYAHSQGVVHRDIKPGNLMVVQTPQGDRLKVLDFGVAKAVSGQAQRTALTAAGMTLGTPYYLAPEQVRGEEIDGRADLYAVGATMIRLLTGKVLVTGNSEIEMMLGHLSPDPHVLPLELSQSPLASTLTRAIAKDRDQRFGSAREMLARLATPDLTNFGPALGAPPAAPKRSLWPWVLAASTLVAALALSLLWLRASPKRKVKPGTTSRPTEKAKRRVRPPGKCTHTRNRVTKCPGLKKVDINAMLGRLQKHYSVIFRRENAHAKTSVFILDKDVTVVRFDYDEELGLCENGDDQMDAVTRSYKLVDDGICLTVDGHAIRFSAGDAAFLTSVLTDF